MKLQIDWKRWLPNLIILLVFVLASAIYFWPAVQGKIIYAADSINGISAAHQSLEYGKQGGNSFWVGSMFSGMPSYQVGGGRYLTSYVLRPFYKVLHRGPENSFFAMFFYLLVFYTLLRTIKVDKWVSLAGSFALTLSSYFYIIIAAQHGGKTIAITWMTMVMIGAYLLFRKKYGLGAICIMFFLPMGFFIHPQMSYYMCMLMGVLYFAELYIHLQEKRYKDLAISTAIFAASFLVGLGIGSANMFTNLEYAEETMRGGHSDLAKEKDAENKTKGLDLDYATAWSYGIDESMTFLVPNFEGGASGYKLDEESTLYKDLVKMGVPKQSAKQFCQSAPTYRGDKAFTSGPVYMGAIVCMLFLLALIIVPGPYKWALLAATIFSVLLSWGRHFMPMTDFFFRYFPMYNKFRAVESILIVAEITMPLLAFLGIKQIMEHPEDKKKHTLALYISAGITAGICLLLALFSGSLVDVTSTYDAQWNSQVGDRIYQMILDQRTAMITADAWRSFIFIALAAALLWVYNYKPFKSIYLGVALTVLVVADMWPVDKRFCNDSYFVTLKDRDKAFRMLPYEKQILDNDQSYFRVLNLTTNTFNEARTSYYLNSIGGYSAAKLRRYQDLIDEHIGRMNWKVINMLNTKYIITKGQDGQPYPYPNPDAMGNCWFVSELVPVSTANDESDALRTLDLTTAAVYDNTLPANANIGNFPPYQTLMAFDKEEIVLTDYKPNRLTYHSEAEHHHVAVFSEIYYPYGWKATIDGEPTDIFRVNYMLRAINVPAGDHEIIFTFEPEAVKKGNILSGICLLILLLTLLGYAGYRISACVKAKKNQEKQN